MAKLSDLRRNDVTQWDGAGSGLDADTLDSKQAADLANVDLSNTDDSVILTKLKNVDGAGSGLDADLLRGLPADFACSKNTNGYTKLPNGLIIQWVKTNYVALNQTIYTLNFPIAFPNACLHVNVGIQYSSSVTGTVSGVISTYDASSVAVFGDHSDSPPSGYLYVVAIGY